MSSERTSLHCKWLLTLTQAHTYTHPHTHTYTHIHTHTHTHIHKPSGMIVFTKRESKMIVEEILILD